MLQVAEIMEIGVQQKEGGMVKKKWLLGIGVVVLFTLSILGAGSETSEVELRVAKTSDAVSLDPHDAAAGPSMEVYVNIYEALTRVAPDGTIKPWLALSWERIDDYTVRFYLRKGVKFHDGTDFNATAVKFSVERAIDPDNPARVAGSLGPIAGVEVVDDYTVDIFTSEPYGPVPLAMSYFIAVGIVSPAAVKKYGEDFGMHPVGTGPFRFVEWIPNQRIVLERFPDYWGEPAKLDRIVYKVIPDPQAQHFALERGEVDLLLNPEPARILHYRASPKYTVYETQGLRVMFLGCDTAEGPTANREIRKAIAHAIDANLICQAILEGTAVPPDSFIAPSYFGYKNVHLRERYPYDPNRAREILEELGWEDHNGDGLVESAAGQTLEITIYAPEGRYPKDRETAIVVQYMLQKVGFDAKVVIEPWGTYIATLGKPGLEKGHEKYDLHLAGWASAPDAVQILEPLFHSSRMPPESCCNWFYYENPQIDSLLDAARASTDPSERAELYGEVQDLLAEDLPIIPFAILKEIVVARKEVVGYQIHPLDFYKGYFYTIDIEK